MSLTKDEIISYAIRYISESDIVDFPMPGELFCFLFRNKVENKILKDDEGWGFTSYGICHTYELDTIEKPAGKWIWFSYIALEVFPPVLQNLKLQPPHIVRGLFQNATRDRDIKIVKLPLKIALNTEIPTLLKNKKKKSSSSKASAKIIQFPQKQKKE